MRVTLVTGAISVDTARRTLTGTLYRYGEVGQTSAGPLGVSPSMTPPPVGLPVTLEHDRQVVRASVAMVDNTEERCRIAVRVLDGELGDAALAEALNRTRAAFSLDIEDADVLDGLIISGRWEAVGQVEHPAFNSARIDQIAASFNPGAPMNEQQRARLAELAGMNNRSSEEEIEFSELAGLAVNEATAPAAEETSEKEPAPESSTPVAASTPVRAAARPAVPNGAPAPREATRTQSRAGAFAGFVDQFTRAMRPGNPTRLADVTAALADITHSAHTSTIEAPAWSGELWSGLVYEPQWSGLFNTGPLTNWEGNGWRFTSKLEIQDYAGDKAEIPTDNVTTEPSGYTAARMAVGVDIDRKFFDFPSGGFVESLFEQVRESWEIKLDAKVRAYAIANAVAARTDERLPFDATTNPLIGAQNTLLKAVAVAVRSLKRRRVGQATWVKVNDDDYFTLFSITNMDVPAFLALLGVQPENIQSDPDVPAGTVLAGVRSAATVRTLPGSPIRVEAQNLTRAGIDEAFFGYWAIEEHHTSGIAKATFTPA